MTGVGLRDSFILFKCSLFGVYCLFLFFFHPRRKKVGLGNLEDFVISKTTIP